MTVPMYPEKANLVVGQNLKEFLALGLRVGYFFLEQLQYDSTIWLVELDRRQYHAELDNVDVNTLKAIETEFGIEPWTNHGERLKSLQSELF